MNPSCVAHTVTQHNDSRCLHLSVRPVEMLFCRVHVRTVHDGSAGRNPRPSPETRRRFGVELTSHFHTAAVKAGVDILGRRVLLGCFNDWYGPVKGEAGPSGNWLLVHMRSVFLQTARNYSKWLASGQTQPLLPLQVWCCTEDETGG